MSPNEWDMDMFVSWVEDVSDSNINVEDSDLAKLLNVPLKTNLITLLKNGSGLNQDENFNKYGTWKSALYDVWNYLIKQ